MTGVTEQCQVVGACLPVEHSVAARNSVSFPGCHPSASIDHQAFKAVAAFNINESVVL
jgi:hypothetical protein